MIDVLTPPLELSIEVREYLFRLQSQLAVSISAANGISIIKELPDRPRKGKLYFIETEGMYFWLNDQWNKVDTTII